MSFMNIFSFLNPTPAPTPSYNINLNPVVAPVISLLNAVVVPALLVVGALGTIWCIILGVKLAKAEEQQERDKAKKSLKNAIVGFVLIFVLMIALRVLMPELARWAGYTLG